MASPGIHPKFNLDLYSGEEQKIIRRFANEWYVTSSTKPVLLSEVSVYRAFICKAGDIIQNLFDLQLEVIALFSSYAEFEPRTIDAFEAAAERWEPLRTDQVCRILISKDSNIVEKVKLLLKKRPGTSDYCSVYLR